MPMFSLRWRIPWAASASEDCLGQRGVDIHFDRCVGGQIAHNIMSEPVLGHCGYRRLGGECQPVDVFVIQLIRHAAGNVRLNRCIRVLRHDRMVVMITPILCAR